MAKITTTDEVSVFQIKRWLGLNESPDGDTGLKMGEAAEMRNFRITKEGHLQIRPGTNTVFQFLDEEENALPIRGMWSGRVNGNEVVVCAAGGKLYTLDFDLLEKAEIGTLTDADTFFFGYSDKLYILNGVEYLCWDGESPAFAVAGYRPLVTVSTLPGGGGTELEQLNKLNGNRRAWYSPDSNGTKEYVLPEKNLVSVDWVRNLVDGTDYDASKYTVDLAAGKVTFTEAPAVGTNTLEIAWTVSENFASQVAKMRFAEIYNGSTDNRVFLYGDGSNKAIYSGLDYDGNATAEYFPDMNEMQIGESNTPITALIRQYSKLIAFKTNSAYSIGSSMTTLDDGRVISSFYVVPVNRNIGNEAPGQVRLVENLPRTLHEGGVYEWRNGNYGMTADERQAKRISERVENSLADLNLAECVTFENEYTQDYYIVHDGKAVIHNYEVDAWFVYENFPATCFVMVGNLLYMGTADGQIKHISRQYRNDDGEAIDAFWRSGSMDFNRDWMRKYSGMIFVSLKPESGGRVTVTAQSDRKAEYAEKTVASSLSTFEHLNFGHFSFNTNRRPQIARVKLKVKKFAFYQLIFSSVSTSATATILSTDFRLRYTGNVK